jgi:hypothetical protein
VSQSSPTEIRNSIEVNRAELELSLKRLRGEVTELTDWRGHVARHQRELMMGAAAVGFLLGVKRLRRRRRR